MACKEVDCMSFLLRISMSSWLLFCHRENDLEVNLITSQSRQFSSQAALTLTLCEGSGSFCFPSAAACALLIGDFRFILSYRESYIQSSVSNIRRILPGLESMLFQTVGVDSRLVGVINLMIHKDTQTSSLSMLRLFAPCGELMHCSFLNKLLITKSFI